MNKSPSAQAFITSMKCRERMTASGKLRIQSHISCDTSSDGSASAINLHLVLALVILAGDPAEIGVAQDQRADLLTKPLPGTVVVLVLRRVMTRQATRDREVH